MPPLQQEPRAIGDLGKNEREELRIPDIVISWSAAS
jgi:hypothetical protein